MPNLPSRFPNLNKLFPRLPIRTKLQVAFVLLSALPLTLVGGAVTVVTVSQLRRVGNEMLAHDLDLARERTLVALRQLELAVAHFASGVVGDALCRGGPVAGREADELQDYLRRQEVLYQVRAIRSDGRPVLQVRRDRWDRIEESTEEAGGGAYYLLRARELPPGRSLTIPVELRGDEDGDGMATVPALAVVVAVHPEHATGFCGAVVGEAYARLIFRGLDNASPYLHGTTSLIDASGLFLFHSEAKQDWSSLVVEPADLGVPLPVAGSLPAGPLRLGRSIMASVEIPLTGSEAPLGLYRVVDTRVMSAPIRRFLLVAGAVGAALLILVVGLAGLAAGQFTHPVVRLRDAAIGLEEGREPGDLGIATNDEIEDLAVSFGHMAQSLTAHREQLEDQVAARTAQLEAAHAELTGLVARTADAIVGVDSAGKVRLWNDAARRLLGWTRQEAVGRPATEVLVAPIESDTERQYIQAELAERGAVINLHTERLAKDGRRIPVSLTQTRIPDPAGSGAGLSIILRDVTLQLELEERMRRSERLAAVSLLAAEVAHEINNPVAIITNRIELMEDEYRETAGSERLMRDLQVVRDHAVRLGEITRNLRQFAAQPDDPVDRVSLPAVADRVASLLGASLSGQGVALQLRVEPVPAVVGSAREFETLLLNLINNGAEAMPSGGEVRVTIRPGDGVVEVLVSDQGPGIPADQADHVFEPFYTTKRSKRGMGLGLALCRSIVERRGGRIGLHSEPGAGTTFHITLPAADEVGG